MKTLPRIMSLLMITGYIASVHSSCFPKGRCYVNSCEATPYDLTWTSMTYDTNGNMIACFTVSKKLCIDDTTYNCCGTFNNTLNKIVLSTQPYCENTILDVTVNGSKKGGGIYFDTYDTDHSELRLTNLNISRIRVAHTQLCLTVKPPCNTIADFCWESKSGLCKFSIWDTGDHNCCPTCIMLDKSFMNENMLPTDATTLDPPSPPKHCS